MKLKNVVYFLGLIALAWMMSACTKNFQAAGTAGDGSLSLMSNDDAFNYLASAHKNEIQAQSETFNSENLRKALRRAALNLVGREPLATEYTTGTQDLTHYQNVIQKYLDSQEFIDNQRSYFQKMFEMQGQSDGINFDEPTNLALYLIKNNMDFRQILQADFCVDNNLNKISCSAFKNPSDQTTQAAGIVTTRAFLITWARAFNFRRVNHMYEELACSEFPDTSDAGMALPTISDRVKTFNCTNCSPACYSCHRSLNARASLFYKFDLNGFYNLNPSNSVATQTDTGAVSTVADLLNNNATPVYHGVKLTNLRSYATRLSHSRKFRNCMAMRMTNLMLGRDAKTTLDPDFQSVRDELSWSGFKMKDALMAIALNPSFIRN